MEPQFTFTKSELEEAFKKWNAEFLTNSDGFEEIDENSHILQAENLLQYAGIID